MLIQAIVGRSALPYPNSSDITRVRGHHVIEPNQHWELNRAQRHPQLVHSGAL
jgi:hypothetical protein